MSKHVLSVLPQEFHLSVKSKNGKFLVHIREKYLPNKLTKAAAEATKSVMEAGGFSVTYNKDRTSLVANGTVPLSRNQVGNMIVGEFLAWCSLSEMTFRDLYVLAIVNSFRAQPTQAQEQPPQGPPPRPSRWRSKKR